MEYKEYTYNMKKLPDDYLLDGEEKALVKETNELLGIKSKYITTSMVFTIGDSSEDLVEDNLKRKDDDKYFYILEDGKTYESKALIIGDDLIRDYKIEKLLD